MPANVTPADLERVRTEIVTEVTRQIGAWREVSEAAIALHDNMVARALADIKDELRRIRGEAA